MPKYQIEFNRGGGTKSFKYFNTEDYGFGVTLETIAVDIANNSIKGFGGKLPKTLWVREYDKEKKCPLRGGQRRKLHLTFLETTTVAGKKERSEWYEYNY